MAREKLGECVCPECGFTGAEIKKQKSGLAYRWCPECNAQYFARCEATSGRLLAKCGAKPAEVAPVTVSVTLPEKKSEQEAKPITESKAAKPVPARKPSFLVLMGGAV